jgi:hypothetical protein
LFARVCRSRLLLLRRCVGLLLPEALFQRCHQVDDVRAIRFCRFAQLDTFTLEFGIDHGAGRVS